MMETLRKYLLVFLFAAVPIAEARLAIPWGVAQDLPLQGVLVVSILGNMLPVPFIILFARFVIEWMKRKSRRLHTLAEKLEARAVSKGDLLKKYEALGLFILVAIPLPGTGAWTGALVAAICRLRISYALPTIFAGVTAASLLLSILSYGIDMLI